MKKKYIVTLILIVGFILSLVGLAILIKQTPHVSSDLAITRFVQGHRSPFLDTFFGAVSYPGYPPQVTYLVPVIIIFIGIIGWFKEAFFLFVATMLTSAFGQTVKMWVDRPRPTIPEIDFIIHKGLEGGMRSFPAGHVQSYVAILGFLAIILFFKLKQTWLRRVLIFICIFMIVFIGPSRIYMGEHWASDVFGAYLLGFSVLGVTYLGYSYVRNKISRSV